MLLSRRVHVLSYCFYVLLFLCGGGLLPETCVTEGLKTFRQLGRCGFRGQSAAADDGGVDGSIPCFPHMSGCPRSRRSAFQMVGPFHAGSLCV